MNRKKAGTFLSIPSVMVVIVSFASSINVTSAELDKSLSHKANGPNFKAIIESLLPEGKDLVKRQQIKDDNDNEEINELSRLQDPANQEPQVGGSINEGNDADKVNPTTAENALVPSDQNQSSSDSLANISDFLKSKEGEGTIPVDGDFTLWTSWSSCPNACGRTALRSRERYCTNPAPANGGKNCEGPRFQLKLCKIKACRVDGGYSPWSAWSSCSHKCGQGMKKRRRHCNNPEPANGGRRCRGARKQVKPCYGKHCQDQDSIVDIDPQTVCGYNPCMVAKCILLPYATCVSDFKCRPVFFDSEERKVSQCTGDNLYLNVDPQAVCRFNPCKYTTCLQGAAAKCVVNTRCHPVFLDAFGKTIKCKGVFKVPARYICGYDPCSGAVCKEDPTARCLVEHTCKAMFVNSFNQRMDSCKARHHVAKIEDEGDEQLSEEDSTDDAAGRISKLMSSKLGISSNDNDDDDDDGDETRLSKLMSSKLGVGKKDDDDDDDNDDGVRISKLMSSKLGVGKKDGDDDDDNDDGVRISKLMSSKLGVGKKDDDDDNDNDDGVRISKLMSSKLSASGKDVDDDSDNADDSDKDSSEESDNSIRSKLPSRFKPPNRKDFEKGKKNRFRNEQSKHVKSNHKRWLENTS